MFSLQLLVLLAPLVTAHVGMWHPSMFGYDREDGTPKHAVPIREMDSWGVDQWFKKGFENDEPAPGQFLPIVSGGSSVFELSCQRAFTTQRKNHPNPNPEKYACNNAGALHTANQYGKPTNRDLFGGTYIAISYTNDIHALKPEDMTIISVNWNSPWTREARYEFPKGMPKCPPGGCLCSWGWIHTKLHGEGYGDEIYNELYRCDVTGQTDDNNVVPKGKVPAYCYGDDRKCVSGPKQPMYLFVTSGSNMAKPARNEENPTYNYRYGFKVDGAQQDAVVRKAGRRRALPPQGRRIIEGDEVADITEATEATDNTNATEATQ